MKNLKSSSIFRKIRKKLAKFLKAENIFYEKIITKIEHEWSIFKQDLCKLI